MFEWFTGQARRAIVLAQDEAIAFGHDEIGTGHLLLGLTGVRDAVACAVLAGRGVTPERVRPEAARLLWAAGVAATGGRSAMEALAAIGIDVGEIRRRAEEAFGPGSFQYPRPPFTPRARKALELSVRSAAESGHHDIDTGHVLLGLLAEDESTASRILAGLGVDAGDVRGAVAGHRAPGAASTEQSPPPQQGQPPWMG